jgi:membrane-bound lytic murein transglycosylase F
MARALVWMFLVFISFCYFSGCKTAPSFTTLEDILNAGEITVITRNNAHCYYLYRDQAMGFEYDLTKAFADYLGASD